MSEQKEGYFVLRRAFWRGVRTKLGVFCAEEGILRDAQNKKWGILCWGGCFEGLSEQKEGCFVLREHQMMCIVGTARWEDSPLGMLLPGPTERNIRQSYTPDVVPLLHIKFNEH